MSKGVGVMCMLKEMPNGILGVKEYLVCGNRSPGGVVLERTDIVQKKQSEELVEF